MYTLLLLAFTAMVTARPSYIAVPADQIAFIDLNSLRRAPRSSNGPPPSLLHNPAPPQPRLYEQEQFQPNIASKVPRQQFYPQPHTLITIPTLDTTALPQRVVTLQQQPQQQQQQQRASNHRATRYERPPDFGEYVDFGAHTGEAGAFGWYSDYPLSSVNNNDDASVYESH